MRSWWWWMRGEGGGLWLCRCILVGWRGGGFVDFDFVVVGLGVGMERLGLPRIGRGGL